jgi:hypothetical protein
VIGTESFDLFLIDRLQKPYLFLQCYVSDFIKTEYPCLSFVKDLSDGDRSGECSLRDRRVRRLRLTSCSAKDLSRRRGKCGNNLNRIAKRKHRMIAEMCAYCALGEIGFLTACKSFQRRVMAGSNKRRQPFFGYNCDLDAF